MSDPRYPILVRLTDTPVLVVGGGPVAARKVRRLLASGARVTVVAPAAQGEISSLAQSGALRWHARPFAFGDVRGARLVFAATGDAAVDDAVVGAARKFSCWVNAADSEQESDFDLPAVVHKGLLQVAVSTGGAAPGVAARVVREIGDRLPEGIGDYVTLLQEVRDELRRRAPDDRVLRQQAFAAALHCGEGQALAEKGELEAARGALWQAARAALEKGDIR